MWMNRKAGRKVWAVLDWWETFCAVPVTILSVEEAQDETVEAGETAVGYCEDGEPFGEVYVVSNNLLFASEEKARKKAAEMNRYEEAFERLNRKLEELTAEGARGEGRNGGKRGDGEPIPGSICQGGGANGRKDEGINED